MQLQLAVLSVHFNGIIVIILLIIVVIAVVTIISRPAPSVDAQFGGLQESNINIYMD